MKNTYILLGLIIISMHAFAASTVTYKNESEINLEFTYITNKPKVAPDFSASPVTSYTVTYPRIRTAIKRIIVPNGTFSIENPQNNEVAFVNGIGLDDLYPQMYDLNELKKNCSVSIKSTSILFTDPASKKQGIEDPISHKKVKGLRFSHSCR